jgi:hypothetical protein
MSPILTRAAAIALALNFAQIIWIATLAPVA